MTPAPYVQRNAYKGTAARPWVRIRFADASGMLHERDLVADTGCPWHVILGQTDWALLSRGLATGINTNFGALAGGWLHLTMPELGIGQYIPA